MYYRIYDGAYNIRLRVGLYLFIYFRLFVESDRKHGEVEEVDICHPDAKTYVGIRLISYVIYRHCY